jgi:xenotropic and polytropic retrovirus receptor 1
LSILPPFSPANPNSIHPAFWDIFYDWSLGNPRAKHPLLRDVLAFPHPWTYYLAILLNTILRFNWIFYAIYQTEIQTFSKMNFGIAVSEVVRRSIWATFRIDNEHCANITQSRAYNDVILPYISHDLEHESNANAAHAETAHQTLNYADLLAGDNDPAVRRLLSQRERLRQGHDVEDPMPTRIGGILDADPEDGSTGAPVRRASTLSRMGTIIGKAHTQDFERKRIRSGGLAEEVEEESSGGEEADAYGGLAGYASSEDEIGDGDDRRGLRG